MDLRDYYQTLKDTADAWLTDKSPRLGAALAFYSVLSIGPLLLLVLAAAGAVFGVEAAHGRISHQISDLIGSDGAHAIEDIIAAAGREKAQGLWATLAGIVTLLLGASGAFGELQDAMNTIWKVAPPQHQSGWHGALQILRERFLSFAMVMGAGFMLLVSLVVSAGLAAVTDMTNGIGGDVIGPEFTFLLHVVNIIVSYAIITGLFATMFKFLPDARVVWRDVWHGALLTALLFTIGKAAIGLYLGHSGIASSFGAAGSIVVLLVWIYYSAQILFFGAEFTKIYAERFGSHKERIAAP